MLQFEFDSFQIYSLSNFIDIVAHCSFLSLQREVAEAELILSTTQPQFTLAHPALPPAYPRFTYLWY